MFFYFQSGFDNDCWSQIINDLIDTSQEGVSYTVSMKRDGSAVLEVRVNKDKADRILLVERVRGMGGRLMGSAENCFELVFSGEAKKMFLPEMEGLLRDLTGVLVDFEKSGRESGGGRFRLTMDTGKINGPDMVVSLCSLEQ